MGSEFTSGLLMLSIISITHANLLLRLQLNPAPPCTTPTVQFIIMHPGIFDIVTSSQRFFPLAHLTVLEGSDAPCS